VKVSKVLKIPERNGRLFGLELEAEGSNLPVIDNELWRQEDDGSLRGVYPTSRCEYVVREPISIEDVCVALDNLKKKAELQGTVWKFSFRTSFHVHVNVSDLDVEQVKNIVYTYRLLEGTLALHCDEERHNNRFCLRAFDCDEVEKVTAMIMKSDNFNNTVNYVADSDMRYGALNLCALKKYGSLEFRMKEGTDNFNDLILWVNLLNNLVSYAINMGSVKEIASDLADLTPKEFVTKVLKIATKFDERSFLKDVSLSFAIPYLYQKETPDNEKKIDDLPLQDGEPIRKGLGGEDEFEEGFARRQAMLHEIVGLGELNINRAIP